MASYQWISGPVPGRTGQDCMPSHFFPVLFSMAIFMPFLALNVSCRPPCHFSDIGFVKDE
jgi:hypothetical protein